MTKKDPPPTEWKLTYPQLLHRLWYHAVPASTAVRTGRFLSKALLLPAARLWALRFPQVSCVAITGSGGKSTTRKLVEAVLATSWPSRESRIGSNRSRSLITSIFRLRSHDGFCVQEFGAFGPDTLDELLYAFRPTISVVTAIGTDHLVTFRTQDAIAGEKAKIVMALPPNGLAVLNADDERVRAMAKFAPCRVLLAGSSQDADLRAEEISSVWPEPLSLVVCYEGQRFKIRTRLHGEQWAFAILACIGVGLALGVSIPQAAAAVATVEPLCSRMSVVQPGDGTTWICDDRKAAPWTYPHVIRFLSQARVPRKILILGQFSDTRLEPRKLYARLARAGREVADQVCLVGQWAHHGLRARPSQEDPTIAAFSDVHSLARFLQDFLRPGDLIFVKGAAKRDQELSKKVFQLLGSAKKPG